MTRLLAVLVCVAALQAPRYAPARFSGGSAPAIPIAAVGGGEVLVELDVNDRGGVDRATVLRAAEPFTEAVLGVVRNWRFIAARRERPVSSKVLVAAIYRPPTLEGFTLGTPPEDIARPSLAVPAPVDIVPPPYPPTALSSGVVLLEVHVAASGAVDDVRVLRAAPPFDAAAIAAARRWTFRPGHVDGAAVPSNVYIAFAFRPPIT